jgi:hypothetical protein
MGWLQGILGGVIGAEALSVVKGYFDKHGGMDGVVAELEQTGYGQQVNRGLALALICQSAPTRLKRRSAPRS